MKGTDRSRLPGAVVGKALADLSSGSGRDRSPGDTAVVSLRAIRENNTTDGRHYGNRKGKDLCEQP